MKSLRTLILAAAMTVGAALLPAAAEVSTTSAAEDEEALAAQALAVKIVAAISALGESPSEDQVLEVIAIATADAELKTTEVALQIIYGRKDIAPAIKRHVLQALKAAQLALNTGEPTGGVGDDQAALPSPGGQLGGGGGVGYLAQ